MTHETALRIIGEIMFWTAISMALAMLRHWWKHRR